MNSKDILIVTRCFWPQCGPTELSISDLARNLQSAGHAVTIATVRWSRYWSENIEYHGIPVVRFAKPVNGPWSSFRYARLLSKHLATKSYDSIIVSGVGDEAAATIRCVDELTPVIIRLDNSWCGIRGSLHRKHVECCLGANAVVANSKTVADMLNRVEEMPAIHVVRDGIQCDHGRRTSSVKKRLAREALSAAHPILQIEPNQPLAVTFTPFETGSGLIELVSSWPKVLSRLPQAKLWLIGDGSDSSVVWQHVVNLNVAHSVIMPGFFDNLTDLFAAADLYIHPSIPQASNDGLVRAIASGLPFVSTETNDLRGLVESEMQNLLVATADWSRVILNRLIDRDLNAQSQITQQLQQSICKHFSPQKQVEKYLNLMVSATTDQVAIAK